MYADPNHKPEMALALSDFEALCGFSTTAELQARLAATPELAGLVGAEQVAALAALPAGAAGQDHPAAKQVGGRGSGPAVGGGPARWLQKAAGGVWGCWANPVEGVNPRPFAYLLTTESPSR